jgi:hypothetical protein
MVLLSHSSEGNHLKSEDSDSRDNHEELDLEEPQYLKVIYRRKLSQSSQQGPEGNRRASFYLEGGIADHVARNTEKMGSGNKNQTAVD